VSVEDSTGWRLTLYVSGASPRSTAALEAVRRICDEDLRGRADLQVVDVTDAGHQGVDDAVVVVPTLVRRVPEPRRTLVGDLSDVRRVRVALDLGPTPRRDGQRTPSPGRAPSGRAEHLGIDGVLVPRTRDDDAVLSSAEQLYRVVVEEMGDGAAVVSGTGVLLYANQRFAELLGHDRTVLLGAHLPDVLRVAEAGALDRLLSLAAGTTTRPEQLMIGHADGSSTPVLASATGLELDGGVVRCLTLSDLTGRVEAEQPRADERAAERARYEELFESGVVGITRTTPGGRILQCNRAAARMYGFASPEEFIARTPDVRTLFASSEREPFSVATEHDEASRPGEGSLTRRDGSTLLVRGGATAFRGPGGEVTEYLTHFVDVTERDRFEQEARESLARYRTISELTTDFPCSVLLGPDGAYQVEWATQSLERAVGYSVEEINALGGLGRLVDPDDLPRLEQELLPPLLSGAPIAAELRLLTKAGESLYVQLHARLAEEHTTPPRVLVGMTDVTVQHLRLEALRLSQQRMDHLMALTPAVIFWVSETAEWTPTFMSGNVEDLLGYPEGRFREGMSFWQTIVYPDDWALLAPRRTSLPEGRHQSEYRFRHGDGSLRWLNEQLLVVRSDEGGDTEIIGSWTDITELRATAEALQLADRQLQELMVQLSSAHEDERRHLSRELHDNLGQILTSASLFAKAASQDLPPERREVHDRVRSLIDEALAATRSLAWTLHRSEQSDALEGRLHQLVEDVSSGSTTDVDLEFRGHGRSVSVRVESVVYRIVQEALTNVVRHARARHAWVIVTVTGGQVGIVISDDGVGFDASSTATLRDHVGLRGMQERAQELGGTLRVDSRPGWGTTLRFNLAVRPGDA
jgi:PAS domain S-box-containing protein